MGLSCSKIIDCFNVTDSASTNDAAQTSETAANSSTAGGYADSEINSLYAELDEEIQACLTDQAAWEKARAGFFKTHPNVATLPPLYENNDLSRQFRAIFRHLLGSLEAGVLPIEHEVRAYMNEANKILAREFAEIDKLCAQVHSRTLPSAKCEEALGRLYHYSILVIKIQLQLLRDIRNQIQSSIANEKITRNLAESLVRMAVLLLTKITLPDLSTKTVNQDQYMDYIFDEVRDEVGDLSKFQFAMENELNKIRMTMTENLEKQPSTKENVTRGPASFFSKMLPASNAVTVKSTTPSLGS